MIELLNKSEFLEKIERFKIPLSLSLIGIVLIVGGMISSNITKSASKEFPKESIVEGKKLISVDVSGAVSTPGVYKLKADSRVEDAIAAAGGFKQNANHEYISKYLNLAQLLIDGSKIYIPPIGDVGVVSQSVSGLVAGSSTQAQVSLNNASQSELESLPGVGPVTASKIISGRPYQKVEDLLGKKVVGKATFDKIKDSVVVY